MRKYRVHIYRSRQHLYITLLTVIAPFLYLLLFAQFAQLQKAAYPDVVPIMTTLRVTMAFNEALDVATSMPGWTIVASDIDAGRIEASQSRWFRFTDDIVIRVVGDEDGSRIDMRSTSRRVGVITE